MNLWKKIWIGFLIACVMFSATGCAELPDTQRSVDSDVSTVGRMEENTTTTTSTSATATTTTTTTITTTTTTTAATTVTTTTTTTKASPSTTRLTTTKTVESTIMVWIPTNGGKRYHSKSTCSGMIDPDYVTLSQAEQLGFTPCGRCY